MNDDATLATCTICAHPMPVGAKKCTECGEFQSPLSRVMAGFDLKGILALLPLVTLIYVFVAERLEGETSNLNITTVACTPQGASIFASNSGNRTAFLEGAGFQATDDQGGRFDLPDDLSLRVFEPGAARIMALAVNDRRNPGGLVSFASRDLDQCEVRLSIKIVRHDQTKVEETGTCACPSS